MENRGIFAYCTTTMIKFLLLAQWTASVPKDEAFIKFFQKAHNAYVKHCSNPFYVIDSKIEHLDLLIEEENI